MSREEKTKAFMEELKALCQKHKMGISGCGCCSSPWIMDYSEATTEFEADYDEPYRFEGKEVIHYNGAVRVGEDLHIGAKDGGSIKS